MSILARRLKEARLRTGLSQEQLGIEVGLDPASASARMNRYELARREPNLALLEQIAKILDVPLPYLFTEDEAMARLILSFSSANEVTRDQVLRILEGA